MSSGAMGRRSGDRVRFRQRRVIANTLYGAILALCIFRIPTGDCSLVSVSSFDFLRKQDVWDQHKNRDRSDLPSGDGHVPQEEYSEKNGGCSSPYDEPHPHGPKVSVLSGIYSESSEENTRNHQQQQFEAYNGGIAEPTTLAQLGRTSRHPPFATSISKYQHSDAAQGTSTITATLTRKLAGATAFVAVSLALLAPLARALSSHWPYFLAGAICASASHTAAVPLDVLKTRIQCSSPIEYKGTWDAFVRILRSEGAQVLFCGAGATVVGYAMQGFLKFGFFEFLKPFFSGLFGVVAAGGNASPVLGSLIAASVAAEIVGSSALTPLEAARIRMVAEPNYAKGLHSGLKRMFSEEGMSVLTRGLPAVLAKQLPYTVTKLVTFDLLTRAAASNAVSPGRRVWITTACAMAAGMLSSLASQPGDSLLSTLNSERRGAGVEMNEHGRTAQQEPVAVALCRIARDAGLSGLFRGTAARMMHVTAIVTVQLVIYQSVKNFVGIRT